MDSGESMTFTVLILLLLIIIVMFACHYLGPRTSSWMRTNREEKIGLSKNKLFHSNGYMLPSGSAFLLSNSGNFQRFDIAEKDDTKNSTERLPTPNATTPFWNIPNQECEIPPQPLRPAPEPGKTVTFRLSAVDEISLSRIESESDERDFEPCLRFSTKSTVSSNPIKIEAPPPPRIVSTMAATNGSTAFPITAIPRPTARRNILQDQHNRHQLLTRRNSSTNPFLCDIIDNITAEESNEPHSSVDQKAQQGDIKNTKESERRTSSHNGTVNGKISSKDLNPFLPQSDHNGSLDKHNAPIIREGGRSEGSMINGSVLVDTKVKGDRTETGIKFRPRSFSETHWSPDGSLIDSKDSSCRSSDSKAVEAPVSGKSNPFSTLAQRAKGPHMLQKTFSEDFLFRKIAINPLTTHTTNGNGENGTWSFGRSILRQNSLLSLRRRNSSQSSQGSLDSTASVEELGRAISCESVNSDSVFLCDLDQPYTQITGYLCVGLHYDNLSNDGFDLLVSVNEAKGLIAPFNVDSLDTFVRIYLVPDSPGAMQTQVVENSTTPCFNESFRFWMKKQNGRHSLWFHVYHNGDSHTLIGEAEMEIHEAPRTISTWIPLSDSRKRNAQWGELMFSLSYLPTAERLTIVVVKARNLKFEVDSNQKSEMGSLQTGQEEIQSVFVKVYLMNNERKVLKKRTSLKRKDRSITFNEAMIFSVPPQGLTTVQLRLTVYGVISGESIVPLGHVIAGSCATGKGLRHWHQMLSSLRKPVSMWHVLRRATNQPVFTGGVEAVVAALQSTSLKTKRNSVF